MLRLLIKYLQCSWEKKYLQEESLFKLVQKWLIWIFRFIILLMPERRYNIVVAETHHFTPRQLDILGLILEGKTNREIASQLNIAPQTVKNLISGKVRIEHHETKDALGIFGVAEKVSKTIPNGRIELIRFLLENNVLVQSPVDMDTVI